ncbi:LysR family transcriptional regulator [Necropsobacter massiliensis]|uniref:LysR family transcriptional regulator n=1 Tax=Necropsobacter massiliensis TaxID=1400001 RepID=UPI000595BA36|nr:LysR family transcriptional regulator [Necropsobacter massiliensis]
MDKLTAIKVFLSVAETGSFTASAEALDISKPMISRYVALMEEWLNSRLFQRSTRKVSLTEAGEQAVVFCRNIAASITEMEQEMVARQGDLRGTIRLTGNSSFGSLQLVPAINDFLASYPRLHIQLDLSDRISDLFAERFDLAVRVTNQPDPNLIARKLADCHSLLVASPDYLATFGVPMQPDDLRRHRYLAHSNVNRRAWHFRQNEREIVLELTSQFTTNDANALLGSVLNHNGIAMLPRYMIGDYIKTGQLQAVLTDWQLPEFQIFLIYASRHKQPLAVKKLISFLLERFAGADW